MLPNTRQKFSSEDDIKLVQLVNQYGTNKWGKIASIMGNKSSRQCRDRYNIYLKPNINYSPWTEVEDVLLMQKYSECGPRWVTISRFFSGRTDVQLKNRWTRLMNIQKKQQRLKLKAEIRRIRLENVQKELPTLDPVTPTTVPTILQEIDFSKEYHVFDFDTLGFDYDFE